MHIDYVSYKNIILFDGGRSTLSFKLLKNFKGLLNDIIVFYRNSKYKFLIPEQFENKFKNKLFSIQITKKIIRIIKV